MSVFHRITYIDEPPQKLTQGKLNFAGVFSIGIVTSMKPLDGFFQADASDDVTEPQLLRVKEPEPLRLTLVNLGCLGNWSFLSLAQLL